MQGYTIPNLMQLTDADVLGGAFQQSPGAIPLGGNPRISLRTKIAQARAARLEEKRQIDKATMPYVQVDIIENEKRQMDITSKIDEALNALKAPPPTQQTGFNDAELYAGAIGGLLGGGQNLPDILNALSQASGARNQMEFEDKLRQYGLTRESTVLALRHLQGLLEDEVAEGREMRRANIGAQQDQVQRDDAWERMFTGAELDADQMELKRFWDVEDQERDNATKLAIEKLKLEADGPQKARALEEKGIDNFGARVGRQFPAGHQITQQQAVIVNAEADNYVDNFYERDTPEWIRMRAGIGDLMARDISPSLAWQKEKYEREAPARELQGKINEERLKDLREKPTAAQKAQRTKINALDAKIDDQRRKNEVKPTTAGLKLEWALIRDKRKITAPNQQYSFDDFLQERYPEILGNAVRMGYKPKSATTTRPERTSNSKTRIENGWVYEKRKDGWYPVRKA